MVNVLVIGTPNSGKSTIAQIIIEALKEKGLFCDLEDDSDEQYRCTNFARKIAAVADGRGIIRVQTVNVKLAVQKSLCPLYPAPQEETCVCGAGSDVSGSKPCSIEYAQRCRWYKEFVHDMEKLRVK